MARSYEKINYSLRPAKNIERKMIVEVLRKLSNMESIDAYYYIGFGSMFFSDFSLFHRSLGLINMISIEKDEENRERFLFNRPYGCIKIEFGHSNEVLPRLDWTARSITWLDYDNMLNHSVITDLEFICSSTPSGSVLLVSVNAEPGSLNDPRLKDLQKRVGEDHLPGDITEKDLAGWGTAKIYRRIINNIIEQTLTDRNGGLAPGNKLKYMQLFNFNYCDNAKMVTVGGLIFDEEVKPQVNRCDFHGLPFVKSSTDPYKIETPNLTFKEMRYLDEQLPIHDPNNLDGKGIPSKDLRNYANFYKWFPNFAETDV